VGVWRFGGTVSSWEEEEEEEAKRIKEKEEGYVQILFLFSYYSGTALGVS